MTELTKELYEQSGKACRSLSRLYDLSRSVEGNYDLLMMDSISFYDVVQELSEFLRRVPATLEAIEKKFDDLRESDGQSVVDLMDIHCEREHSTGGAF